MNQEAKVFISIGLVTLTILLAGLFFLSNSQAQTIEPSLLIKEYNHKKISKSAKVTLVEFADFQCPACAAAYPNIKRLLEEYPDTINFIYRHFPLPQHKNAILAAKAAEAAGEQGKFWEMYDFLYQNQIEWSEQENAKELFIQYAKDLKIDITTFTKTLNSNKNEDNIQTDKSDGLSLGVNSTPTFIINNKKFTGAPSYQNLKSAIETELRK